MTFVSEDGGRMHLDLAKLYRLTSIIWVIVACGMSLTTFGSTLLDPLNPARVAVGFLAALMGVGMLARAFWPGRPEWTQWTLPLMGFTSVMASTLALFAVDFVGGGYTVSRCGYAILLLSPALFAYTHWIGEKVVAPR